MCSTDDELSVADANRNFHSETHSKSIAHGFTHADGNFNTDSCSHTPVCGGSLLSV